MLKAPTYHLGEGYYVDSEPDLTSNEEDFEPEVEEFFLTDEEIKKNKSAESNFEIKDYGDCVFYIPKKS